MPKSCAQNVENVEHRIHFGVLAEEYSAKNEKARLERLIFLFLMFCHSLLQICSSLMVVIRYAETRRKNAEKIRKMWNTAMPRKHAQTCGKILAA